MLMPKIDLSKIKVEPGSRERTLEAMERYRKADAELERLCKERGIPVPKLVCSGASPAA